MPLIAQSPKITTTILLLLVGRTHCAALLLRLSVPCFKPLAFFKNIFNAAHAVSRITQGNVEGRLAIV